MTYRLRNNVSFCICANRTIFLDLDAGRYFGLPQNWDRDFRLFLARSNQVDALPPVVHALLERGVLVYDAAALIPLASPSLPPAEWAIATEGVRPTIAACCRAVESQLTSTINLRATSLAAVVERIRTRRKGARPWDGKMPIAEEIAASFERTNLLLRPADRCLARSIAFLSLCMRRGCFPNLVIGVRVNPFVAHCWVQHEGRVLNDMVERVRLFTPILVV